MSGRGGSPGQAPHAVALLVAAAAMGIVVACAAAGATTAPGATGSAGDTDEATAPPPRGMPSPRLADTPPPEPVEEEVRRSEDRYLTLHGEQDRQRRQVADPRPAPAVEAIPLGPAPSGDPAACAGLNSQERIACPLRAAGAVESIADIAEGVRLQYRKDPAVSADELRRMTECQKALAAVNPGAPSLCPFVQAGTEIAVSEQRGKVIIDLRKPPNTDVSVLRTQVRSAFPKVRR